MALWKYHKHMTMSTGAMPWATVQKITLTDEGGNPDAGDLITLTYDGVTTVDFVTETNQTAAAMQTALRTATGDTGLTVTGTTDVGPFTVTFVNEIPVDIISAVETGLTSVVVTVQPNYTLPLKGPGPYVIHRVITEDVASVGSPTYEVKTADTHPTSTVELADEGPAEVILTTQPIVCDDLVFSGLLLQDTDNIGVTVYYESAGDRRF
jgi:hypothetical protein